MTFAEEMGHRLRLLRHMQNLTQQEVADRLGVTRVSVSHWELGNCKINSEDIVKLSKLYGISSDYILGLKSGGKK